MLPSVIVSWCSSITHMDLFEQHICLFNEMKKISCSRYVTFCYSSMVQPYYTYGNCLNNTYVCHEKPLVDLGALGPANCQPMC